MSFILSNWHDIVGIAGAVIIVARLIVKVTPTPKDDSVLASIVSALKAIGLHLD